MSKLCNGHKTGLDLLTMIDKEGCPICAMEAQNKRLRDALEFYSNEDLWFEDSRGFHIQAMSAPVTNDKGKRAREALQESHE